MSERFDYVIVGGGSAGCVAAAKLADKGKARVLVLEAGYSHRNMVIDMPAGIKWPVDRSKFMRFHTTVPQEQLDGRAHDIPQANVLGGGSSVNAQIYTRGRPSDYDEWDEILRGSNDTIGWSWKDVVPHIRRMEGNNRLNNHFHAADGPLLVSDAGFINDASRWFVQSVQALGEPFNPDFNGPDQRGVGFYQFTNRNGRRCSAARAFLDPQKDNPSLTIRLRSAAERVMIEGKKAVGVVYRDRFGRKHVARADQEVILSAGALITPKLLMLSGIGPADHLRQHGIERQLDLPGVGQHLMDHPEVPITAIANGPYGYYKQDAGLRLLRHALHFKLFGAGPFNTVGIEAGAFVNPAERDAPPTIQTYCVPIIYLDRDRKNHIAAQHGVTVTTVVLKPKSRGTVRLRSPDPDDPPLVSPNLLMHEDDMRTMIAGQCFFMKAFSEPPWRPASGKSPSLPPTISARRPLPPIASSSSRPTIIRQARQKWGPTATGWRCSMPNSACAASMPCGSAICRRYPTLLRAIRTRSR